MNATDIRKGTVLVIDGVLHRAVEVAHRTPGNLRAFLQVKLKNLRTGLHVQQRFRSSDRVEEAYLDKRAAEYLYQEGNRYVFMDVETYDQFTLGQDDVGDLMPYVKHNARVEVTFHDGNPVSVDLPASVVLRITKTDPGYRGNTVTNVLKSAVVETGLEVKVPPHINQGDLIKISTDTGEFLERVSG